MARNSWLFLCLLVACKDPAAAPSAALTASKPVPAVAALAADPQAADMPPISLAAPVTAENVAERGPPPQGLCEVELSGDLAGPPPAKGSEFIVYVCEGDCLAGGRTLQRANARGGPKFFTEVFVPCGTSLGVCAAVEPEASSAPAPTAIYGQAKGTYLAIGQGEIEFKQVHVQLEAGPPRTFAAPLRKVR